MYSKQKQREIWIGDTFFEKAYPKGSQGIWLRLEVCIGTGRMQQKICSSGRFLLSCRSAHEDHRPKKVKAN